MDYFKPKAPPPPSPAVEETVTAQEAAATAEQKGKSLLWLLLPLRKKVA